jgi:GH15 family glucan-1,4-alpha-glucosidase
LQLDIYGEAFDALYHAERKQPSIGKRGWNDLRAIVDWVCENWDQPKKGSGRRAAAVKRSCTAG